jgi:Fur family transcriptional regulator, ferric uptake regulator
VELTLEEMFKCPNEDILRPGRSQEAVISDLQGVPVKFAHHEQQERIRTELRESGLRATPARVAVLAVLRQAGAPLTHAEVAEQLEGHGWDRATVFRNLVALSEVGFAKRSDLGDHAWRFEAVADATGDVVHEHPHFLCTACGSVVCIPEIELKLPRGVRLPRAVKANSVEVHLRGLCDECG